MLDGSCGPALTGGLSSQVSRLTGADALPRIFGLDQLTYNVAEIAGPALPVSPPSWPDPPSNAP